MRLFIFNCDSMFASTEQGLVHDQPLYRLMKRLAALPNDQVIAVTGRAIGDSTGFLDIPGIIVGGHHGLEWQLPGGMMVGPFHGHEEELIKVRSKCLFRLMDLAGGYNLDFADRLWSLVIDMKNCDWELRQRFTNQLSLLVRDLRLPFHYNRDGMLEVQMISSYNKSIGVNHLARFFGISPPRDKVYYTGDDVSDRTALWWNVLSGNTAVVVRECLMVPETLFVKDSEELFELFARLVP